MKKILFISIIVIFYACHEPEGKSGYEGWFPDSYILGFVSPENIEAYAYQEYGTVDTEQRKVHFHNLSQHPLDNSLLISVRFVPTEGTPRFRVNYSDGTDNADVKRYYEKVKEIGDTHFKGWDKQYHRNYVMTASAEEGCAVNGVINDLSIVCNKTIDAEHPAGSDVSDLFDVFFEDLYWVVQNGYRTYDGADGYRETHETKFPYAVRCLSVADFIASQRQYISSCFFLYAKKLILPEETYTFTIKVETSSGKTCETKVVVNWKIADN